MPDAAVMPELPTAVGARAPGSNDLAVSLEPQLVALGHLARLGMELCPAELRWRTAALMRGELDQGDAHRTVNDLGLMAGAVTSR